MRLSFSNTHYWYVVVDMLMLMLMCDIEIQKVSEAYRY